MFDISKANLCINCDNFMEVDGHKICKLFLTEDKYSMVTGELAVTRCVHCETARSEQAKCGIKGTRFVEKVVTEPTNEISVVTKGKKDKKEVVETSISD